MKYDQGKVDALLDHLLKADAGEGGMIGSVRVAADMARDIREPEPVFKTRRKRTDKNLCVGAGGLKRCMDCRCGVSHVEGERAETWADGYERHSDRG